jgi:RND superfamily putative drug exporter
VTALQIGLIVAIGVLLDTFVVRTLLIPALVVDIGPWVWWPSRQTRQPAEPRPAEPQPSQARAGWAGNSN